MRITLVQPPSNYEETFLLSPPLGFLSIAAAYFYPNAVELIELQKPDMVGFTPMAIESHVCLETVRLLKENNPNLKIVFGGPHFGAIAEEVLEHYE